MTYRLSCTHSANKKLLQLSGVETGDSDGSMSWDSQAPEGPEWSDTKMMREIIIIICLYLLKH